MRPEILEEKITQQTDVFQIVKKTLRFSPKKGKKVHYNVVRLPIAVVFPLTAKNELYLIRQYRYLYGSVLIEPIAGHVEKGESSVKAAMREMKEEAGIEAEQLEEFARLNASGSVVKSTVHFFIAKGLEMGKANLQDDEDIEVFKISLAEAANMVMDGTIKNSSAVIGILMLERMKREKKL